MDFMLTIGISTIKHNLNNLLDEIRIIQRELKSPVRFLIVSQRESVDEIIDVNDTVSLIKSTTSGLSVSRNIVIKNCSTTWLWFQDDDIHLDFENVDELYLKLNENKNDVILAKIGSLENQSELYKKYKFHDFHTWFNMLKISSIEIIVKMSFLSKNKLFFDEMFGLGAKYPCCEENIFMIDCYNSGAGFHYYPSVLCYHTTILESRNIDFEKNYFAKGVFLKKIPLYISVPLIIKWTFKSNTIDKGKIFLNLFKGFLSK